MNKEQSRQTALLLIDIQEGFDNPRWGTRNNPAAEQNAARLLKFFRENGMPVFHIQHQSTEPDSPLRPELPGCSIKEIVRPISGEPVIAKQVNSAFIGTDLEARLRRQGISELVIAGLTTDHCVSTTTRMGGNLGFRCFVAADATATFNRTGYDGRIWNAEDIYSSALASLHNEFATVRSTDELLVELKSRLAAPV